MPGRLGRLGSVLNLNGLVEFNLHLCIFALKPNSTTRVNAGVAGVQNVGMKLERTHAH